MAIILNPITTAVLSEAEVDAPEYAHMPFKYVIDKDNFISLTSKFTGGRYVKSYVGSLNGKKLPDDEIHYLTNGKFPMEFFYRIEQFFRDVMAMPGFAGNYEAQVFIIDRGGRGEYEIVVPHQRVSQASVSYRIEDELQEGDIIVMDIHSHNTMGAFWSGTDNADDAKNTWVSGVFGTLNKKTTFKFRFNDGMGNHYDLELEDVFEVEGAPQYSSPKEWLDKVQATSSVYGKRQFSGSQGYSPYGQKQQWQKDLEEARSPASAEDLDVSALMSMSDEEYDAHVAAENGGQGEDDLGKLLNGGGYQNGSLLGFDETSEDEVYEEMAAWVSAYDQGGQTDELLRCLEFMVKNPNSPTQNKYHSNVIGIAKEILDTIDCDDQEYLINAVSSLKGNYHVQ